MTTTHSPLTEVQEPLIATLNADFVSPFLPLTEDGENHYADKADDDPGAVEGRRTWIREARGPASSSWTSIPSGLCLWRPTLRLAEVAE